MNNVHAFLAMKEAKQKITMVTCYDYTSARILDQTAIDAVLVGDSGVMTMHGAPNTTAATNELMRIYTQAVSRGITKKFIVADLPFMSYRKSLSHTMTAVENVIQAGAHAVKLEGVEGNVDVIKHIVASGVPVMGHMGLTPQHIHRLGGYKVQGMQEAAYAQLLEEAHLLVDAGCFAIVLECIPEILAAKITAKIPIPTIGIGAGAGTDGQVLVFQDLLGLNTDFKPKFVKYFLNGERLIRESINTFVTEVQEGHYPDKEHAY